MKRKMMITLAPLSAFGVSSAAWAVDYPLPPVSSRLIGQNQYWTIQEGDCNLQAIARHFGTAAMLILEANDTIAPVQPKPGTQALIPSQTLLPDAPREGIVVNLAELRLYYFPPGENQAQVYPLGVGQLELEAPETTTCTGQKISDPTWTPTASIRARSLKKGVTLPAVVPTGPYNPLGRYALHLTYGNGECLIHGTNAPDSIGLRISSGCMRVNADDIKALFNQVKTGTLVRIINQPVKLAVESDGKHYVEVHRPLSQTEGKNTRIIVYMLPAAFHAFAEDKAVDDVQLKKAMSRRVGYPVVVFMGTESVSATLSAQNTPSDNSLLTQQSSH